MYTNIYMYIIDKQNTKYKYTFTDKQNVYRYSFNDNSLNSIFGVENDSAYHLYALSI